MRLTQKELASLAGTDQAHISRIENGEVTGLTPLFAKARCTKRLLPAWSTHQVFIREQKFAIGEGMMALPTGCHVLVESFAGRAEDREFPIPNL